jgi:hypothetical protein
MNAGGTDAAPTIAGPGLKLAPAPEIAIGAPTISAEAMATTATARATIDRLALRHALCFFVGSVTLEKIPRLRGVRAARVGGNCVGEAKSKSRLVACKCGSSRTRSLATPATQCGLPVRTRRATRLSMLLSMISSPRGFEHGYRVYEPIVRGRRCRRSGGFRAADVENSRRQSVRPVPHAGRPGVHRETCAITIAWSGKRAREASTPAPTAAIWRRATNSR